MALKNGLDNALLEYKAKQAGFDFVPQIELDLQAFPQPVERAFKNVDVMTMYGSFFLILVPLCQFMIFFDELAREKVDNLRLGM